MARKPKTKSMFGNMKPQDIKALGIGLELTMVIGGMTYGGYWLDERWGTGPWLVLVGVCLGVFGGGWHAMKMANGGKLPDMGFKPKPKATAKAEPKPEGKASPAESGLQEDENPKP